MLKIDPWRLKINPLTFHVHMYIDQHATLKSWELGLGMRLRAHVLIFAKGELCNSSLCTTIMASLS